MGRWGYRLFEGDQDIDIACDLGGAFDSKPILELSKMVNQTDMMAPQEARDFYQTEEYVGVLDAIIPKNRKMLDAGLGDKLFDKMRAEEKNPTLQAGGSYNMILVGALLMRAGAKIRDKDMEYLRELVPKTPSRPGFALPIFDEGFRDPGKIQFLAAMDHYKPGNPRSFQEPSCFLCGNIKSDIGHGLSKCGRCKYAFYCDKECQTSHWKIHKPICASHTTLITTLLPETADHHVPSPMDSDTGITSLEVSSTGSESTGSSLDMGVASEHLAHLSICPRSQRNEEILGSPLLTLSVLKTAPPAQFALIGADAMAAESASDSEEASKRLSSTRLFHNVAVPSSVFICGSQGSGKSNTLACLLENCLLPGPLGKLPRPLTGIVFHYDSFVSDSGGLPCEAAHLASSEGVRGMYSMISNVQVEALQLGDGDLNTRRMIDLMAVGEGSMPLYMHIVNRILRDLRIEQQKTGQRFDHARFKDELMRTELTVMQLAPLKQRLETLESFMPKKQSTMDKSRGKVHQQSTAGNSWTPQPGQLTIVDLSCPCVTAEMACSLFNITLSLFLEQNSSTGRVVALDEAHKYIKDTSAEARTLTENIISVIRLQRHLGVRVLISTQEPTVSPKLLDLCSVTIVHRFTSPDWLRTLRNHLAGVSYMSVTAGDEKDLDSEVGVGHPITLGGKDPVMELFAIIVGLRTGQALVFAPSAAIDVVDGDQLRRLAHRSLRVQVRSRLTGDGGRSVMAG
ncbi:hypothetical protein ACHAQH_004409 [Verticillium albo-atrum]